MARTEIKVENHFPDVRKAFAEQLNLGLEVIGATAEGYAKKDCPVDTGRLRNSITHQAEGNNAYIGSNVEYAAVVEFNAKVAHTTGKAHFLRDAATNHGDEYRALMEDALKSGTS